MLSLVSQGAGDLFAGTDAGVFRSTDEGGSWTASTAGLPVNAIVTACEIGSDGFLYGATQDSGIYRSSNSGSFWDAVNAGLSNPAVSSLALGSSGYLFAGAVRVFGTGITVFRTRRRRGRVRNSGCHWIPT